MQSTTTARPDSPADGTEATPQPTAHRPMANSLTAGMLPKFTSLWILLASWAVSAAVFLILLLVEQFSNKAEVDGASSMSAAPFN